MIIQKLPSLDSAILTISNVVLSLQQAIVAADSPTSDDFKFLDGMNSVILSVQDKDVRFTIDGNDPTLTKGSIANPGQQIVLKGGELDKVKLIRNGTEDATVFVEKIYKLSQGEF